MNIVFIGFASCGKSATAWELSKRINLKFVDLDKEIEVRYYLSHGKELHYRDIILKEGPQLFFEIENEVLGRLRYLSDCVVAPGGGAPLCEKNRAVLKQLGPVIYLKTAPAVVLERMKAKGLPLFLRDDPGIENLEQIWHKRDAIYADMADHTIDNSQLTIGRTTDRVVDILKENRLFGLK